MNTQPTPDHVWATAQRIREQGSLSKFADSLCAGCKMGQIMERRAPRGVDPTRVVWCRSIGRPVAHDITACSAFLDAKTMDLNFMSSIAHEITGDEFHSDSAFNEKAYR